MGHAACSRPGTESAASAEIFDKAGLGPVTVASLPAPGAAAWDTLPAYKGYRVKGVLPQATGPC